MTLLKEPEIWTPLPLIQNHGNDFEKKQISFCECGRLQGDTLSLKKHGKHMQNNPKVCDSLRPLCKSHKWITIN